VKPNPPARSADGGIRLRLFRPIATIYEAAAQILQREGEANFTTNRIAERAGFSIGTVYQYFPNKDAILLAIAERELGAVLARMRKALAEASLQTQPCASWCGSRSRRSPVACACAAPFW
jgi:AcrR family transcriptional regulator